MAAGVVAARVVVRDDDVQVVRLELVGWIHHILQVDVYCLHDWEALGCFMESRSLLSQGSLRSPWVDILRAYSPYGCPRAHYVHPGLTYFGLTALMGVPGLTTFTLGWHTSGLQPLWNQLVP